MFQELKWQAAIILGSVDFLGSPLGLVNDLSEGVSSLIYDRSVKTLVKNVTHGLSNSTAKLTESISDGVGRVIMDDWHEEVRQRIRSNNTNSKDHFVAGFKGLGFGLFSGMISIGKQTYDGAVNDGFPVRIYIKITTLERITGRVVAAICSISFILQDYVWKNVF